MDYESLRIFCAVAAELSITHAATRLRRAPSNVSTRVQQLEAELGVALFIRVRRRLQLSQQGETFLGYAQRLLALEDEARQAIGGDTSGATLRIGSMESTAASRLPTLLAGYHARHPQVRLQLSTGPSRLLIENVRTGHIDCAFVALAGSGDDEGLLGELGLQSMLAWPENLQLLLPPGEPADSGVDHLQVRSLVAFAEGCAYRRIAERALGLDPAQGWSVQVMASYHAMVACVAAGTSTTVLPGSVAALARIPPGVRRLELGSIDTLLVWREGYQLPAFERLRASLGMSSQ